MAPPPRDHYLPYLTYYPDYSPASADLPWQVGWCRGDAEATQTLRAGCSKADPQTNKHTNRQGRLQYNAQLSAQCNNVACRRNMMAVGRQAVRPLVGSPQNVPYPASGDFEQPPREARLRSPCMSVMRVIVLHPCTKFEVCGPYRSENMADFPSRRWAAWWSTFFLSVNEVTGHGFLPANVQFAKPFQSRLRIRHGTDGRDEQTDRRRPSIHYATTLLAGGNIINSE